MRRASYLAVLAIALTGVAAGCGDAGMGVTAVDARQGRAFQPDTSAADEEISETTDPTADETVIELLDPGAEPRQTLRRALVAGTTAEQRLDLTQDVTMEVGGNSQPVSTSSATTTRHTVRTVEGDRATIDMSYVELEYATPIDAGLVDELKGITVTMVTDERGAILSFDADTDSVTTPALRQLLESLFAGLRQLAFVFPEEDVGVGARWRTTSETELAGLPFKISQEITVTGLDGDHMSYDVVGTIELSSDDWSLPGLPASVEIKQVDMSGTTAGSGDIDLTLPVGSATVDSKIDMHIVASSDGEEIELNMTLGQHQEGTARRV